ncbi:heavy-metal-associated domain-containing protein [Taibaiella koreensis]|uniref:heavy-metal-associated domain-containing protein n=1 Tax=Taibaiella koreensis TaxID=1268548 RepID=UPI0013C2F505|nr:cation transporter [Taibaiella koreensis]
MLLIGTAPAARAQFTQVSLGVNGLTCSQCSRSVEMQLRKLPFVADVTMDLGRTEGLIRFRDKQPVRINAIARAVKDAGFSLRYLEADLDPAMVQLSGKGCFQLNGDAYYVSGPETLVAGKVLRLQFVGKDYGGKGAQKGHRLPEAGSCRGKQVYYTVANAPKPQ